MNESKRGSKNSPAANKPAVLSPAQKEAVEHQEGPMLVLAGPGSGKTFVITSRLCHMINDQKIPPADILVITFTRAAAEEMKERFYRLNGGKHLPVAFGTFHSVFFHIIKHAYHYTSKQILTEPQKYELVKEALKRFLEEEKEELIPLVLADISTLKNTGGKEADYHPTALAKEEFVKIYQYYQSTAKKKRLLDFDDMLLICHELFLARPDILKAWQNRYRYILIDEFQDINQVQYEIVKLLAGPARNLFIVGDDDQSIYRFRGAKPEIMLGFEADYPGCKRVCLETNYRCSAAIVNGALKIIENNKKRFPKQIKSHNPQGMPIKILEFKDQSEAREAIIKDILCYHEMGGDYSEIALIYRSNHIAGAYAEQLAFHGIPFELKETPPDIYRHFIARDLFAYLNLGAGSRERKDFLQVMNKPLRYLRRDLLEDSYFDWEELLKYYEDKPYMEERIERFRYDIGWLSRLNPFAAVNYIGKGIGYLDYLKELAAKNDQEPEVFLEVYEELRERARAFLSLAEWQKGIRSYEKKQKEDRSKKAAGVAMQTMHGSKGLEYRRVYLIAANEGITPHKRSLLPEEIEEERRMFYVALTRAKEELYIAWSKEIHGREQQRSRFIEELLEKEEHTSHQANRSEAKPSRKYF